jgi:hypothetical protein
MSAKTRRRRQADSQASADQPGPAPRQTRVTAWRLSARTERKNLGSATFTHIMPGALGYRRRRRCQSRRDLTPAEGAFTGCAASLAATASTPTTIPCCELARTGASIPPSFPSLIAWTFFHRPDPKPSLGKIPSLPF